MPSRRLTRRHHHTSTPYKPAAPPRKTITSGSRSAYNRTDTTMLTTNDPRRTASPTMPARNGISGSTAG